MGTSVSPCCVALHTRPGPLPRGQWAAAAEHAVRAQGAAADVSVEGPRATGGTKADIKHAGPPPPPAPSTSPGWAPMRCVALDTRPGPRPRGQRAAAAAAAAAHGVRAREIAGDLVETARATGWAVVPSEEARARAMFSFVRLECASTSAKMPRSLCLLGLTHWKCRDAGRGGTSHVIRRRRRRRRRRQSRPLSRPAIAGGYRGRCRRRLSRPGLSR